MANIYGIDLGTTNICVTLFDTATGQCKILRPHGRAAELSLFPAVVYYDRNDILVGESAKHKAFSKDADPERVFRNFKPYLGTEKAWVVDGNSVTPVSLYTLLLLEVKRCIELRKWPDLKTAVITCPATFGPTERQALQDAATEAGIAVDPKYGILDEPTAAALDYDLEENTSIVVVDLGGGTLDINLMAYKQDSPDNLRYESINNGGRKDLGGRDWDELLIKLINEKILTGNKGYIHETIVADRALQGHLGASIENLKNQLTDGKEAIYDYYERGYEISVTVTRKEFETVTKPLLDKLISYIDQTLQENDSFHFSKMILVGGATLMPQIYQAIEVNFSGHVDQIEFHEETFYSVARGAAKYQQLLENGSVINRLYESYYVGPANHEMSQDMKAKTLLHNIFQKGEILSGPALLESDKIPMQTVREGQNEIFLGIYQATSVSQTIGFQHGKKIGTAHLELPQDGTPRGSVFSFQFLMDNNKMLSIEAQGTGKEAMKINGKLKL